MNKRRLGQTGIEVPALGVGTAAWGFKMMGYGKGFSKEDLYAAYVSALDAGANFFDTAEGYARGESERFLGEFHERDGRDIVIATKFKATSNPRDVLHSLDNSLSRLGVNRIHLYQLHYPPSRDRLENAIDALAETVKSGKVLAVGVCNFNEERMKRAIDRLSLHGIPLASTQVYYHLLERRVERNGVLDLCRSNDIALIPYSPMAQGLLTGKLRYNSRRPSLMQKIYLRLNQLDLFKEERKRHLFNLFSKPVSLKAKKLESLFSTLDDIAAKHDATISQVALNWLLSTDPLVIPIPGAKNVHQVTSNIATLKFKLTDTEYETICRTQEEIS